MKASFAIYILSALLLVGACLQCEVCQGSGNKCTGTLETCPAGQDFCSFTLSETTMEKTEINSIIKGCATYRQCEAGPVSMNFGNGQTVRTNIACCMGEACKTPIVIVPPVDTKPNGLRCHGCYDLSSGECREETIDCTGPETQCVDMVWILTAGGPDNKLKLKGCSTTTFCKVAEVRRMPSMRIHAELININCTAAATMACLAAGPPSLLSPALPGLLLLQLLSWFPNE